MSEFRKISESEEGEINDSHQGIIEFNYRPIQVYIVIILIIKFV